ncbi:MAG: hypothetical protein ACI4HI_10930 [Lachnospiraceae bacterium]
MKKHYELIKLDEHDMRSLRLALAGDTALRIPFASLMLGILLFLGFSYLDVLKSNAVTLILFFLALEIIFFLLVREILHFYTIMHLKRSSLIHYIHTSFKDAHFYSEEIPEGFIIQILPVKYEDILYCRELLESKISAFQQALQLADYLLSCLSSTDKTLVNKGVIYTEIVSQQLDIGNDAILSSHDRLCNLIIEPKNKSK